MTALDQRLKDDVRKSLSNESTKAKKTCEDIVDAVRIKIHLDLVDGWKKMETHFKDESARLVVGAEDQLLRRAPYA